MLDLKPPSACATTKKQQHDIGDMILKSKCQLVVV